jgi:class 3 adenylate cyclase
MDPEDWGILVDEAVNVMGSVVAHYGGTVSKFAGDAVVAFFGAPKAHEDDPYRAVLSGMEICRKVRESKQLQKASLDVRVGVHTGLTVVKDVEAGSLTTYSALGDAVNVASRLQGLADPGSVVVSAETLRLLGPDVEAIPLGPAHLKGRNAPVDVYQLQTVSEPADRSRGLAALSDRHYRRRRVGAGACVADAGRRSAE